MRRSGFRGAAGVGLGEAGRVGHDAHAAPPAAGNRLQHHAARRVGAALLGEEGGDLVDAGRTGPGQQRHAALLREFAGPRLVAEEFELRWRRADEGDAGLGAGAGETGALAQEPVAGMERIGAALPGRRDQGRDVEVGGGAGRGQRDGPIGEADVQRLGIVAGMDGDATEARIARRTDQSDGDLAAVGDQQGGEHSARGFRVRWSRWRRDASPGFR